MRNAGVSLIMGCILVLEIVVVHSAPGPHELKKMAGGVRRKCLAQSGTTAEVVDEAEIGNFSEDMELKCYFKCVLETFNMIGQKNNKLNFSLMRKIVPEHFKEIGNEMIDACTGITGPNRCQLAYDLMVCLYEANPVAFFVV